MLFAPPQYFYPLAKKIELSKDMWRILSIIFIQKASHKMTFSDIFHFNKTFCKNVIAPLLWRNKRRRREKILAPSLGKGF